MDGSPKEIYLAVFDRALWICDRAFEVMNQGREGDKELTEKYRSACLRINMIAERWEREGYGDRYGSLVDLWFKEVRIKADGVL